MLDDYLKAKKLADKAFHQAVLHGQFPYISCLDEILTGKSVSEKRIGVMDIPVHLTTGTVTQGRRKAFAYNYMPLSDRDSEFAYKWSHVYDIQTSEGISDPLKVYEYKHRFYVQEGNKRLSVFRYLGMLSVSAEVYRVTDSEEDSLYNEFLSFYRCVPLYEIDFSVPGRYRAFVKLLGKEPMEVWSEEEVSRLRSSFYLFLQQYQKVYPENTENSGDAFFLYISVYGYQSLRQDSFSTILDNIRKLRKEFDVVNNDEPPVLVEEPVEQKTTAIQDILHVLAGPKVLKAAFIYDSDAEHSAYVFEHEIGRILLEHDRNLLVQTSKYEFCDTEDKLQDALNQAAESSDIIFTTSPLQMNAALKTAVRYPEKIFMNCSCSLKANAVRTYSLRTYEVKFLLGALAAVFCKNHRIAYQADYPIYGTIADINAFAIGASMIDPDARIYLSWAATPEETQKKQMEDLGISICSGPDSLHQKEDTTAYGIYRIDDEGKIINLAEPVVNWAVFYKKLAEMIRSGNWNVKDSDSKAVSYRWGMNAGVLDVRISGSLPYPTRKLIGLLKQALIKEALDPFSGELHSQNGQIQTMYDGKLTPDEIIQMDWLNDNVIGSIPAYSTMDEAARQITDISGVRSVRDTE